MIYIVVRKTTDWGNEATFRAQIPAGLEPVVELWNTTFEMPYHLFRRELKRIAQLSLSRIQGAVCVARDEIPKDAVVLPTDDDDWFSPRLAKVLEENVDGRHAGYHWPSQFIEVPISLPHQLGLIRRAIFPRTPPKWLCTTNNYAVVMRSDTAPLIDSHIKASRWFIAHPAAVKRLGEPLSVMNRSLASRTSLRSKPSRSALVRKFRRYETLYRRALPPELSWCEPYVVMMRDLMDQLRLRR
ncbi:MAG: hypothetical protein ACHQ9S_04065 [Candidatus Binatia bacterium]